MQKKNQQHSLIGYLISKFSRSILSLTLFSITVLTLFAFLGSKALYDKQIDSWLKAIPEYILPSLLTSDYYGINNQIKSLEASNLFDNFIIADLNKKTIRAINNKKTDTWIAVQDPSQITWGYISYTTNFIDFFLPFLWMVALFLLILLGTYLIIKQLLEKNLQKELGIFNQFIDNLLTLPEHVYDTKKIRYLKEQDSNLIEQKKINTVINRLIEEIIKSHQSIETVTLEKERHQAKSQLAEVARQVAHDIRTPLSVLNAVIKLSSAWPEEQRTMIYSAIQQINDTANNLLTHNPDPNNIKHDINNATSPILVSTLLDRIVSEKRFQHQDHTATLTLHIEEDSYPCFTKACSNNLKRIISNLINNAYEAIPHDHGHIQITLSKTDTSLNIDLSDNGQGMSSYELACFQKGRLKSSKLSGSGIGLASAQYQVTAWGGQLSLQSQQHVGTTVGLQLPICEPARWFSAQITVAPTVVILDDDENIHTLCRKRMTHLNVNLLHFYSATAILSYDFSERGKICYLCDYQLMNSTLTGIDVIHKLQIQSQSILVTNRYEDERLQTHCQQNNILILPKNLAAYVPIVQQPEVLRPLTID